jgi:hypothetical protein
MGHHKAGPQQVAQRELPLARQSRYAGPQSSRNLFFAPTPIPRRQGVGVEQYWVVASARSQSREKNPFRLDLARKGG